MFKFLHKLMGRKKITIKPIDCPRLRSVRLSSTLLPVIIVSFSVCITFFLLLSLYLSAKNIPANVFVFCKPITVITSFYSLAIYIFLIFDRLLFIKDARDFLRRPWSSPFCVRAMFF